MVIRESRSEKLFTAFNYVFLVVFSLLCILPMINVLAVSFSEGPAAEGGLVGLWPIGANVKSYDYIVSDGKFVRALLVSLKRLALGLCGHDVADRAGGVSARQEQGKVQSAGKVRVVLPDHDDL